LTNTSPTSVKQEHLGNWIDERKGTKKFDITLNRQFCLITESNPI